MAVSTWIFPADSWWAWDILLPQYKPITFQIWYRNQLLGKRSIVKFLGLGCVNKILHKLWGEAHRNIFYCFLDYLSDPITPSMMMGQGILYVMVEFKEDSSCQIMCREPLYALMFIEYRLYLISSNICNYILLYVHYYITISYSNRSMICYI